MYKVNSGFTLVEILVVLAIIAILLTLALPDTGSQIVRVQVSESVELVDVYKAKIAQYYYSTSSFPEDNAAAGMPEADKILGNYVTAVSLEGGAIHLMLGNKIRESLAGKQLTVQPVYVDGSPNSPVSWICGYDQIPEGMKAAGSNYTNVERQFLPMQCY